MNRLCAVLFLNSKTQHFSTLSAPKKHRPYFVTSIRYVYLGANSLNDEFAPTSKKKKGKLL